MDEGIVARSLCLLALFAACTPDGVSRVRPTSSGGGGSADARPSPDAHANDDASAAPDATPGVDVGFVDAGFVDAGFVDAAGGFPDATPPPPTGLPILGNGQHTIGAVRLDVIGEASVGFETPTDLAFNPRVPGQLWVVNQGDNSVWIADAVGTASQRGVWKINRRGGGDHFLARPSALAFGLNDAFATAQDEDRVTQPTTPPDFMGPTLWTANVSIFDAGDRGHIDMLHNSPRGKGIAWERDNVYWYFDGAHSAITRYNFNRDHGPGGTDHSDGEIARFVEGQVAEARGVPSHMVVEQSTGRLFVADTGNRRIAVLDIGTGRRGRTMGPNYDGVPQFMMDGATISTFIDGAAHGLVAPSGLELVAGVLYVSDNATSRISAFGLDGARVDYLDTGLPTGSLMGMAFDANGHLFLVDAVGNRVLRISPR